MGGHARIENGRSQRVPLRHRGKRAWAALAMQPMAHDTDTQGSISGAALHAQMHAIQKALTSAQHAAMLSRLSPSDRETLAGLTAVGWAPIPLADRAMQAAAESAERAHDEFRDAIVRASITENYKTIWRVFLAITSDEALISRTSTMIHRAYDRGTVAARMVEAGRAMITVDAWPDIPDRAFHGLRVATQTVLELSGRKNVAVHASRAPAGATFDVRWRR